MDMNKAFYLRREDAAPKWHLIDAKDQILGRMSTKIADLLTGKGKADFAPHTDNGDYVVVVNAKKVAFTGNKLKLKTYISVSGWMGNKKEVTLEKKMNKDPRFVIEHAVKGMLPKNKLSAAMLKRLRVYVGEDHLHQGQF
jgi:large subunit ribosomal protein L13